MRLGNVVLWFPSFAVNSVLPQHHLCLTDGNYLNEEKTTPGRLQDELSAGLILRLRVPAEHAAASAAPQGQAEPGAVAGLLRGAYAILADLSGLRRGGGLHLVPHLSLHVYVYIYI